MPDVVFDACTLSNFAGAGGMGLLERMYGRAAWITSFVVAETWRGLQARHFHLEAITEAIEAGWLKETAPRTRDEKRDFRTLARSLGLGEASSIAVARGRGLVFASDDRVARGEAVRRGVALTGTVGILVKAVRSGACGLAVADGHLERMIAAGFRAPVKSVRALAKEK